MDYWGEGNTPLPLVLVDDVADALHEHRMRRPFVGQTLLLTSPPLLNAREYAEAVARVHACPNRCTYRTRHGAIWAADMAKELAKNAIRHPNRRWPSLHDWRCQAARRPL